MICSAGPRVRFATSIDRWVMRFAGTVVLVSLLPAHFVSLNWLWLTAFVGANLLRVTAITNRDDARFDVLIAEYRLQRAAGAL